VCRRWRAVISASASRLDIGINVRPKMPDDIETILSGPWPILINYRCKHEYSLDSSLKRMYSALEQHDRVRGISLNGSSCWFDDFFKATNCPFPALESLYLRNRDDELNRRFLGDQIYPICVYGVLNCAPSPSHRYLDFYHPRRLSQTSFWNSILSAHQQECPFSLACKACLACAISI
jgi:hypothetical protein